MEVTGCVAVDDGVMPTSIIRLASYCCGLEITDMNGRVLTCTGPTETLRPFVP